MPIYEYRCEKCGKQFEYFLLPSSPAASCPACKSKKLNKLISAPVVATQGSSRQKLRAEQSKNRKVGQGREYEETKAILDEHK